ncbi:aspartate aminotransferase family protein [candidate division KSB1 bacterium]|nr:aspartate aminotransferase family protein [candidate division KSB1 bacterium]RQW00408.1 MAG: aspartate aminotransferase family protein [candidate division KSB1 bacterium]
MENQQLIYLEEKVLLGTYARPDFVLTHGKGSFLYDSSGKEYLDFVAGIAVCAFGHADAQSQKVLAEQASKLWHCSNLYHTEPQVQLAQLLVNNTFADKVFFCNSGTEAMEATIKFARKWAKNSKNINAVDIISMHQSFHGRTYGALSATGQAHLHEGFEPLLPGFHFAHFNDIDSVQAAITEETCAILVEPVQGEGGIWPATKEFLQGCQQLCKAHNLLLILDEIQCGFGRTGTFCAYEQFGIKPDIMAVAKPIAAGLPLGAVLVTDDVGQHIKPGNHGTTFGGGPLACAVALDVLARILQPAFLADVREKGKYFFSTLKELQQRFPEIVDVRGKGLMLAIELAIEPKLLVSACAEAGLLICKTGGQAVRFLPPLNVTRDEMDLAARRLASALENIRGGDDQTSQG